MFAGYRALKHAADGKFQKAIEFLERHPTLANGEPEVSLDSIKERLLSKDAMVVWNALVDIAELRDLGTRWKIVNDGTLKAITAGLRNGHKDMKAGSFSEAEIEHGLTMASLAALSGSIAGIDPSVATIVANEGGTALVNAVIAALNSHGAS